MQFSLSSKRTVNEAWDAITVTRISSNRARKSTLQALRKEWESLAFKPGEDVDDFALHLNTLLQKLVHFGDGNYDEERAIKKLFRCVPEKYKQMAHSIESLLDLSMMSIEEAIGRLKVVNTDEHSSSQGPSPLAGSFFSLESSEMPAKMTRRRGSLLPRLAATSVASRAETPRPGREDVPRVMPAEATRVAKPANAGRHEMTPATPTASLAIGPGTVDSHNAPRPTSHRWRRSHLCSWHM
jgi:hypothetical protein